MRLIKIGLANINTTVGAFASNTDRAIGFAKQLAQDGCAIGCFQEQVIGGYPAEDLVQWRCFVDDQWKQLQRFAAATARLRTVFVLGLTIEEAGHLYNAAAVIYRGRVVGVVPKEKLPTYGVFYENRTFSRGLPGRVVRMRRAGRPPFGDLIFRFPFGVMAVEVCEDIWSPDGPMRRRTYSGAELVVNVSASPWRSGITATRREMISTRAADNQATVVYVNQVGGNDSLVFDGGGYVNQNGRVFAEAERWREGLTVQVIDLDRTARQRHENTTWRTDAEEYLKSHPTVETVEVPDGPGADLDLAYPSPANKSFFIPENRPTIDRRQEYFRDLIEGMITGLDYYAKTLRRGPMGIALSGGKDSVLTLIIARLYAECRFAGMPQKKKAAAIRDFIYCFSMPTRFNTATTRNISRDLCRQLGVTFKELPIEEAFGRETKAAEEMLGPTPLTPVTVQNIQARIRGMRMWNWANSAGAFWLQTSNMSEKAVGYTTIGGDMMGAYSLIANLPKTVIIELLRFIADEYGWPAVKDVLETKASAELAAGQEDEKDLMPFPVLDACFALFAGEKMEPAEVYRVVRSMFSDADLKVMEPRYHTGLLKVWVEKFTKLFVGSIFKWVQTPESVHLGGLDLDRERALQLPVVQSSEWLRLEALKTMGDKDAKSRRPRKK
jgi:NAD+ synthase (glutamine-hydrolysing)